MSSRSFAAFVHEFYVHYWRDAKMRTNEEPIATGDKREVENNLENRGQGDCTYHAVYVPLDNSNDSPEEKSVHIYRDKIQALKVMKDYKGARFKTFSCLEEAKEYTRNGGDKEREKIGGERQATTGNEEKASNFRGPKPQELVAFRKMIEAGNLEAVKNIVWENPRYLVSSGDTPAILQEGCRYNAMHIVASKGQRNTSQMCELILNTVGDPKFVELLYGEEDGKSYVDRASVLLDLYLNTPDKGLNETPLHFAAKYGLRDVVRILVSYSECLKDLRNKYDQTPIEVICSRKCQEDENLKREIRILLEDQYFVPVLRAEDNTLQPKVGDPFSPTSPQRPMNPIKLDPTSPRMEVRAIAGPMSKPKAFELCKKWKTPPRITLNLTQWRETLLNDSFNTPLGVQDPRMRLNDTEKGLERVGRNLAEEYQVPWKEHWNFLNGFASFQTEEGLVQLERYLENCYKEHFQKESTAAEKKKSKYTEATIDTLCAKLESCNLQYDGSNSESDTDDEYYTPPSSPEVSETNSEHDSDSEEEMCLADEGTAIFIEGTKPTKTDYAVFDAVSKDIKPEVYPFTYRWKHEMQLVMENDQFDTILPTRRRLLMTPEKPRISKF